MGLIIIAEVMFNQFPFGTFLSNTWLKLATDFCNTKEGPEFISFENNTTILPEGIKIDFKESLPNLFWNKSWEKGNSPSVTDTDFPV